MENNESIIRLGNNFDRIAAELKATLLSKQKDYGPLNISLAPGGPLNGLRVRMFDKLQRLSHLYETGDTPNHESLTDTFLDLANYAIIGILVQNGQWGDIHNEKDHSPKRLTNSVPRSRRSQFSSTFYPTRETARAMVRGRRTGRSGTKPMEQGNGGGIRPDTTG